MRKMYAPALAAALSVMLAPPGMAKAGKDNDVSASKPVEAAPVARGRLYAVVIGPGPSWKKGQPFKGPGLDEHRRYWQRLHKEGRVASAGPLGGDTGLAMVRAGSQREVDSLLAGDPAIKAKILRGVARPYEAALVSAPVLTGR